jgi:hypothetical protein
LNYAIPAWGATDKVSVIAYANFQSIRISHAQSLKPFHPISEDVRNFAQAAKLERVHLEEVSRLRRARTVSKHRDSAVSGLKGDTFEGHFDFIMLNLNVLDLSAQGVDQ